MSFTDRAPSLKQPFPDNMELPISRGHRQVNMVKTETGSLSPGNRTRKPRVAIVGVCGSGKSLLAEKLAAAGYDARPVAQEHSLVADLFRRSEPDAVIYLEADDATVARRKSSGWEPRLLSEQRRRLELARRQADIVLGTDELGPDELAAAARRSLAGLF